MKSESPKTQRAAVVLATVVGLAACATAPSTREEIIKSRAEARWAAQVMGDHQSAYGFLAPSLRATTSLSVWRGAIGSATIWKSGKVQSVECDAPDRCLVKVNVEHMPLAMGGTLGTITSSVDETWLLDQGQWWLFERR